MILLAVNFLLFVMVIGGFFSKILSIALAIMLAVIVMNLYKISPEVQKAIVEVAKNKRILLIQRKKIRENEDNIKRQGNLLSDQEKRKLFDEAGKLTGQKTPETEGRLRLEYWEKLEKELGDTPTSVTESTQLIELRNKRKEVENMIDLSKQKYHRRLLDEQSFREIVKEYQKKLIELESEITKVEGKKEESGGEDAGGK
ncbi:MAG: hypothetical protein ABIJ04_08880 [Bacteroidota bacterium]